MKIEITLPMPPSVNCLYAGKARRFKSKKYKEWINECDQLNHKKYKMNGDEQLTAKYEFNSAWFNKNKTIKAKDLSNFFKAIDDYLPNIISNFDDKLIFEVAAKKVHGDKNIVNISLSES